MDEPQPSSRAVPRWLPHPILIHVLVVGVLLYVAFLAKGPWDPDLYWHLETGKLIADGRFPRVDPFSFTWGGQPWVLHEWASQLLLYRLVDGIGYMGAVYVFAAIPGIAVGVLAYALYRLRLRTFAVIAATSFTALLVIPYATVRPQAISWIFFALLVGGLVHLRPERAPWTLLLVPLFAAWANIHGLWVVGLAVLGLYAIGSIVGLTPMRPKWWWAVTMVPLAMLGALATPAGPELLVYPLRYVDAGDWGQTYISEWQSPDFHDPAHYPLFIYMGAVAVFARWRVPWWMSLLAFAGIAMTLLALRNGAVAAILGAPALALGIDAALQDWRPPKFQRFSRRVAIQRRALELILALVVLIAGIVIFLPPDPAASVQESIDRELPVESVELLEDRLPDGRILSWYGWGGYVIGALYESGGRVFVDGRNDMYDDSILEQYNSVRIAEPGWDGVPETYEVDALLFPPFEAISKGPALMVGWCEAYRDENEVLFLRECP